MRARRVVAVTVGVLGVMLLISVLTASTASNTVPGTKLGQRSQSINANALKPTQCAALNLTAVVTGTGTITGTNANELILGGPSTRNMYGMGGNDCIVGGSGSGVIDGGNGTDVCINSPATYTFNNCEYTYGGTKHHE